MAINIYQPCINPVTGEIFQAVSHTPEAFVMKWTVYPGGYVPFEHIHLNQDEIFHIKKGEAKLVMNGEESIAGEGETIRVPKGTAHIAYNNRNEMLECIVEYRPGLDHDRLMQCFIGLTEDGLYNKKGAVSIPRMGYFLRRMKARCMTRPVSIPAFIFRTGLFFMYLGGSLMGWNRLYKKYTR